MPNGRRRHGQGSGGHHAPPPLLRPEPVGVGGLDYFRARAVRESYLARLAKIEFEEKTAKLISRDEVQVAAFTKARTVRDNLLNSDRLAATLRQSRTQTKCTRS